ncbi:Uncharacterised protein [Mycolicibacterium aurum]|uniref:PASTA domain-containing protein n=1 Tax=Mycolicibacterium aurum TaxID=1791 RepID=A0A3S4RQD2_MYCAU|nr:hypothetical protein [Mycolicibacterium aurum]VEG56096.1 Uncharacterised protein [Mycolicibacterium aurum]
MKERRRKHDATAIVGAACLLVAGAIGAAGPAAADNWEMPNVEGEVLQSAWDAVVAATDGALVPETSTAEGPPFEQINLTNWEVCAQSPSAGEEVSAGTPPQLEVARPGGC